jgi:ribonuclease P protein component
LEADPGINTMVKKWALTKRAQYETVYKSGKAKSDYLIVIKILANKLDYSRYGFSVSKNVGNAVKRNYIRRILKEIARLTPIKPGFDMVFIARQSAGNADFHQIRDAVIRLLHKSDLLIKENETVSLKTN